MNRPDILVFMSDQHNADYMACAGDPMVETPTMDRLARNGAMFTAAYTSCPLCVPARASFMTGMRPSVLETFDNDDAFRSDIATIAHAMGAAGYETVLAGRMHFVGEDQRHGFERRLVGDFNRTWGRGGNRRDDLGEYVLTPAGAITKLVGGGTSPVLEYDRAVIRAALKYLEEPCERPRFTVVGTYGPHHPFVAPPELYKKYRAGVSMPSDFGLKADYRHSVMELHKEEIDPETILDIRAAYYGMIEAIDAQLGQILDAWHASLEQRGHRGIAVYLADHGEMGGHHGCFKKELFYEGSARIPILMAGEGIPNKRYHHPVSIMDVSRTICSLAGAPSLPGVGFSLFDTDASDRFVAGEYIYRGIPGIMLRRGPFKYIRYRGHEDEDLLFHLEQDPAELHNAIDEHPEIAGAFRQEIERVWNPDGDKAAQERRYEHHRILAQWGKVSRMEERDLWIVTEEARTPPVIR